jgi:formylglycine-generating enzyme required for sulfatase activity
MGEHAVLADVATSPVPSFRWRVGMPEPNDSPGEAAVTTLFISHSSKENDPAWSASLSQDLRARGYQSLFLDFDSKDGIPPGAKWEQVLYQNLRKCRGVVALCSPHWLESPWCVAEAMIARERGKPVFLLATEEVTARGSGVPNFLKDNQFISVSGLDPQQVLERLLRGLREAGISDDFPLPTRPYPGLEPFTEKDPAIFFGRDADIVGVLERLRQRLKNNARGFILVLGASGCGKSSLVRAGVLRRLKPAGETPQEWVIAERITGAEGLDGLVRSLGKLLGKAPSALRQNLGAPADICARPETAARRLRDLANDVLGQEGTARRVLLVLDQLEEVFGTPEGSEARALLRLLLEATVGDGSPVVVLATMRSDFLNQFQLFPGAQENYEEITLDPMPSGRFAEVIEGPAQRFGLDLDPGLSERLAADTSFNDALPLLAYTLEQLYKSCGTSGKLTIAAYESLFPPVSVIEGGKTIEYRGVAASIKHRADDILQQAGYAGLSAEEPRMRDLRRAFFALARVGEAGQFTRRVALRCRLPASCTDVLERFVNERLLVTGETKDHEPTLSVAHEALFRVWDQLRNWLHQDRRALAMRGQIEAEATERKWPWPEDRVIDAVAEIERSGVSLEDAEQPDAVRAFLGPTGREELAELPRLGGEEDAESGSGRYGSAWRLPLSHEARAKVGVRLALLGDRVRGDSQKGTGLTADGLPDIDWCPVRGGEVTLQIRENMNDPNSKVVGEPTREVEAFHIARYPVTVAQFQAFVRACHDDKRWTATFLRDGQDYAPPKHRAAHANHPADTVNWYDAMAFCEWLSKCLGYQIQLPTEFEWQQAATGGDRNRRYPWGREEWDPVREPWRANTYESGLGRSTAVGMYPEGASPVGALDMAGTLYEWCLNAFDDPDKVDGHASGEERRAVRGGSWNNNQADARCAARFGLSAANRSVDSGLRVCCACPIA